jgi:non-specific serine/threonine protein kinase/serine/threonine-protein kinase
LQQRKLGVDHADTLKTAYDLALVYLFGEKFEKAEPIAREVVSGRKRTLGPRDKETITAMLVLATIYENMHKIPQGQAVASDALEVSRRAYGESDTMTLSAKTVLQGLDLKSPNTARDRAAQVARFDTAAKVIESATATSLPQMIDLAQRRATIAVNQGKPADAEAPLVEALEAARRAGQEELNVLAILAGVYALQKKYGDAEAALRGVFEKPAALNTLSPNVLPFALRSLANGYRNEGRFAEAEPHFAKLVPIVLAAPGERNQQTRVDMFLLADTYSSLRKYAEAEKVFSQLLDIQRRVTGPEVINTVVTSSNIGWIRLQQKRYSESEQTLRDAAVILRRTATNAWERFNVDSMLGAALSAQKKFEEAEPLLISGYNGMGSTRPTTNANMVSRFTRDQAGEALVQLYADWGKPVQQAEWAERVKAGPAKQ